MAFVPWIFQGLSPEAQKFLEKRVYAPCTEDEKIRYENLADELGLNARKAPKPMHPDGCMQGSELVLRAILSQGSDDPDCGMDQDLPEKFDPKNQRKMMGGVKGPNSQGFRHMYFGGIDIKRPIKTFQIPTGAVGEAPTRAQIMAEKAKSLIDKGDLTWGIRTLAWSLHYIEDLAQPYHSTQVPDFGMTALGKLFQWPPSKGFEEMVSETSRMISNYHYGFEAYTSIRMQEGLTNPYISCLDQPRNQSRLGPNATSAVATPEMWAHAVAASSRDLAADIGAASLDFFGKDLMKPGVDIANKKGSLNYRELVTRPDLTDKRNRLHQASCVALANATHAAMLTVEWALKSILEKEAAAAKAAAEAAEKKAAAEAEAAAKGGTKPGDKKKIQAPAASVTAPDHGADAATDSATAPPEPATPNDHD
ncbi:MAG: hypothetical protein JNL01_15040 [Bdellovibrionales bacterium]|nr:hypothetical protein [Bdellovibrionales bacterium]